MNPVRPLLLLLLTLFCALALPRCGAFSTPRNGWNKRWGPLVPHEKFPGDCGLCHVPERWDVLRENFSFDHEKETGHVLEGAHASAACLRCHNDFGPVEAYVARGCAGCHTDIHASGLGTNCTLCHTQENWRPGGLIAEHARTRFPLVGRHAVVECSLCHVRAPTGDFRGAPVRCEACHAAELARATSPDHAANGWVDRCERCHLPTLWPEGFTHGFFPLTGGHAGRQCTDCHAGGNFAPIPSDCFSCHEDDYTSAPGHSDNNYSHRCEQCHNTVSWEGAVIDHSFFPLSGGHAGLDCSRCHTGGQIGSIPSSCISCHRDDYNNADNHSGFPEDCEQCHTINRWEGATFNHTFPLRGDHNVDCSRCHTGGDTRTYTCFDCHEHSRTRTDNQHNEVRDYVYSSAECVRCHPDGRE